MKNVLIYLDHILDAIQRIETYTREGREAFMNSPMAQDAVSRNFEIIGEATKRLPTSIRSRYPDIPWTEMAGFRDILIHEYHHIDLNEVWLTVERDLPSLTSQIMAVRAALENEAGNETQ